MLELAPTLPLTRALGTVLRQALELIDRHADLMTTDEHPDVINAVCDASTEVLARFDAAGDGPSAGDPVLVALCTARDDLQLATGVIEGANPRTLDLLADAIDKRTRALQAAPALPTESVMARLASLVQEFLCDQETLKKPARNEAICEKARALLDEPAIAALLKVAR